MHKNHSLKKDERGMAIVEAAMILPICILMVLAVYYAAIFLCQKANLQANLQNALVYYKNADSDTYITLDANMAYNLDGTTVDGSASSYSKPLALFPYRFFGMKFNDRNFASFFHSMAGHMFFDDGTNIDLTVDTTNYVVYKSIKATVTQTVAPAIDLTMLGMPMALTIRASGEVVITNADDFIRNTDLIIDLVRETAFGEKVTEIVGKVVEFYNKLKQKLM